MTKLQQAMARVELTPDVNISDADISNEINDQHDIETQVKIVERKPEHLVSAMAKQQRNLLDQAIRGLVNLEAKRNAVEGQIDRSFEEQIAKQEENRSRILEMLRAVETDLLSMKNDRRAQKVANQTEYEVNKAAQQKIVAALRTLVADLEV